MKFLRLLLKTGILEAGCFLAAVLLIGHFNGLLAHTVNPADAIKSGNKAALQRMLAAGGDANTRDGNGTPLLMLAVLYGDEETVELLLAHGADPNATNAAQATALIWAAGDPKKSALLLDHGADPNAKSALGRTPLLVASGAEGAGQVVQRLLTMGADLSARDQLKGKPNLMTGGGGAPPLIEAAKVRDGKALALLLDGDFGSRVDVNATDANGGTALTEAVIQGNHRNVRLLLEHGASIEARVGSSRYTPLMLAAMRDDEDAVKMLLEAGADVNALDSAGSSPLMWAAYSSENGSSHVVDLLLEAGADPMVANRRNETAYTWARWQGTSTQVVKRLLRAEHAH